MTAPGGRITEYEYDGRGLKTKEIDPEGFATRFEYDLAGRLTKRTDPLGYETRWEYDLRGKLLKVTDAKGHPTTYEYDSRGLLLTETRGEPVGASNLPTWRFTWDARGNRETATDPNGTEQIFTYDDAGRFTGRTIRRGPGVAGVETTSFGLDVLGRPTADAALTGSTLVARTRRFDSLDRALEETLRIGTGPERSIGRTFDAADNPLSLTYASGRMIEREYDPLNRLALVKSSAGDLLARYEDLGSRQARKVLGNGLTEGRAYDASGWLEHLDVGPAANPNGTFSVTYGRNGRSLKTEVKRADRGKRHAYEYDAASRVVREQLGLLEPAPPEGNVPEVENYLTLDGLLNIVSRERTEAGTKVTTSSETNSRNQVTQWGPDAVAWDANGNVASFDGRTLRYDADNRLVSALLPGGGNYEILRDASGRKVRETLTTSGASHAIDVVQDGDRTLETFAANEGVPLESLVYGRRIDEVVRADLDPDGDGTATLVIPIQDELGNVAYLTGPDGAVLERYDYETYGLFRVFAPDGSARTTSAFGWNRLFQGREYVTALEAYDFRNRLLVPELGRFAQEDPLGYVDSLNLYQAFGGGWVNATDP
ncbi:MAG: RHS repeat protein, partial [Holophagales bacterium]|nr:RHS repeat protein [Holophagales bacterium]